MEAAASKATNQDRTAAQAELRDDELLIVRRFDAPRALVFRVWQEPEHVRQWLAPGEFKCASLEWDFRPGGTWRACIRSQQSEHWMNGRFVDIEANERIVTTFRWEPEEGSDMQTSENRITVTFADDGARTVQSFHQAPFDTVARRDSHTQGWASVVERTAAYVRDIARREAS